MPNVCATKAPIAGGFHAGSQKRRTAARAGDMKKNGSGGLA